MFQRGENPQNPKKTGVIPTLRVATALTDRVYSIYLVEHALLTL